MENNQYIPLGTNHAADDNLIALIELYGMEGYGIYIALLFELRKRADYLCALRSLPALARRWEISLEQLKHIIYDFNLFGFTSREAANGAGEAAGESDCFCSPYLFQLMNPLEEKRAQCTLAGKLRVVTVKRAADGRFTSASQRTDQHPDQLIEKSKEEESKSTVEQSTSKAEKSIPHWELLLEETFKDQSWLEVQAMHSGMKQRFMERLADILNFFKNHVRTYGKEATILSVADAKSYFSNFIRPGSPTRRSLNAYLEKRQSVDKSSDPYRFEERDPVTGERSYCGRPIPADAPPRPHENAVWNGKEWG